MQVSSDRELQNLRYSLNLNKQEKVARAVLIVDSIGLRGLLLCVLYTSPRTKEGYDSERYSFICVSIKWINS